MPVRCIVIDDSDGVLQSLGSLLEREGMAVVGLASTPAEGLRQIEEQRPDLALVDIDLGGDSGFDLVEEIVQRFPDSGPTTILISSHSEADFADLIRASPARGFLSKSELSAARIRALIDG